MNKQDSLAIALGFITGDQTVSAITDTTSPLWLQIAVPFIASVLFPFLKDFGAAFIEKYKSKRKK